MVDFRIQGFDILPDIIGYILFAIGLGMLLPNSDYFSKARTLTFPMIILSAFTIYERPAQGGGIQVNALYPFTILIGIASIILSLFVIYNLFMGIREMAAHSNQMDIQAEAEERWKQYLLLQIGMIFVFIMIFVPLIGVIYILAIFIASLMLVIKIMAFMKRCEEVLGK